MPQQAQNILNAVKVLRSLGTEIERLKSEIEASLGGIDGESRFDADDQRADADAYYSSGSGWVLDGWHWTFPARRRSGTRGKSPRIGSLSIGVDLGRPGWIAETTGFPVLIVAWAPLGDDWASTFEGNGFFPLRREDSVNLVDDTIVVWSDILVVSFSEVSWMYAIPLLSIDNRDKVRDIIINPVRKLISGESPYGLLQNIDVVRFSWEDGEARPQA